MTTAVDNMLTSYRIPYLYHSIVSARSDMLSIWRPCYGFCPIRVITLVVENSSSRHWRCWHRRCGGMAYRRHDAVFQNIPNEGSSTYTYDGRNTKEEH